jgi:hypothetical protein
LVFRIIPKRGKLQPEYRMQIAIFHGTTGFKAQPQWQVLINPMDEMKREAHGTQQPGHIGKIGEGARSAQRNDSLA